MKQQTCLLLLTAVFVFLSPVNLWAETRRYTPPPEKGYVYIVIEFKGQFPRKQSTNVSISWGRWSKNKTVNPKTFVLPNNIPEGFVILLRHTKNDSIPIEVNTNGKILTIYQGNPPSQWDKKGWSQEKW